ncbi:MAG: hypothetical protein ABSE82_15385 [Nitrososphaerales archaeon]|jgi:hypothetical protein
MAEHVDQEKLWVEFKNLAEKNGREASRTSEHFGDLVKFYTQYQPKPTPPLAELIDLK